MITRVLRGGRGKSTGSIVEKLGIDKKVKPKLEIEEIKSLFVELA